MPKKQDIRSRREFLVHSTGAAVGFFALTGLLGVPGCEENTLKPVTDASAFRVEGKRMIIDVTRLPELANTGGYAQFDALDKRLLVIRLDATTASALSRICTHQGCSVNSETRGTLSADRIICPCHGSTFLLATGAVVQGPASAPLQSYPSSISGTTIIVDLS